MSFVLIVIFVLLIGIYGNWAYGADQNSVELETWFNKGTALDAHGKYNEAIAAYDEAIKIDPKFATLWYNKGSVLAKVGRYDEAIAAYDEAIKIDPKYVKAWNGKGVALDSLSKYSEAIATYDEAIKIDPKFALAWHNKGSTFFELGKYDDVILALDSATKIDNNDVEAWYGKGLALNFLSRYDEAIAAYDEAIKIDPKYVKAWNGKGVALDSLSKYSEAIAAYDEAIKIDPHNEIALKGRDVAQEKLDKLRGGCLIATATYGSELAPQVQQLRELRDNSLLQTQVGISFMNLFNEFYYSFSPTISDLERENPILKESVKLAITPMISSLTILNYVDMNSEESVLAYGISVIIINLGMYIIAPVMTIRVIRNSF